MFDVILFGKALSDLRKRADMTQNEVADRLNLSRQSISKYERGESFPDISVLVMISELFGVTLDELIGYGSPTAGEADILRKTARGNGDVVAESIADVVNLAPLLKPSVLAQLSVKFRRQGIDISNIVTLAEYLNDETVLELLDGASFDTVSEELLEKFMPVLNGNSISAIFERIIEGEMDWHLLRLIRPYVNTYHFGSLIECAVIHGVLPWEVLQLWQNG